MLGLESREFAHPGHDVIILGAATGGGVTGVAMGAAVDQVSTADGLGEGERRKKFTDSLQP